MRILFLGDMVGRTGRTAVFDQLPGLISDHKLDFVIVNDITIRLELTRNAQQQRFFFINILPLI